MKTTAKENDTNEVLSIVFSGRCFHCKATQHFYFSCTKHN